jgi:hypothetical protein
VAAFIATPGMAAVLPSDFDGILPPPNLGVTVRLTSLAKITRAPLTILQPPGEFDPFLDVFDWEDLTGIALGN